MNLGIDVVGAATTAFRHDETVDAVHHEGYPIQGSAGGDRLVLHERALVPLVDLAIDVGGAATTVVCNDETQWTLSTTRGCQQWAPPLGTDWIPMKEHLLPVDLGIDVVGLPPRHFATTSQWTVSTQKASQSRALLVGVDWNSTNEPLSYR